jgi:hypothetical protein
MVNELGQHKVSVLFPKEKPASVAKLGRHGG